MVNQIRRLREERGLSQEELATRLGVHWQTVHRAETGKSTLSDDKYRSYAGALGVSVDEVKGIAGGARMVQVGGFVQAGHWAESAELPEEDRYDVPVPDDEALGGYALHAAETRGPSMNRKWPDGTIIVFTDVIETQEEIIVGKRYVVERERADGKREATVKTLWRDEAGKFWLLPESDDPRFQQPIALDGSDGDTVRIVGRVRFAVSRE